METRMDYFTAMPEGVKTVLAMNQYVHDCGLEISLLELVKMRASQLNGCAFCLDMHCKDARDAGESEQRIYALPTWREAPFYTERERAALALTEAVTLIAQGPVSDEVYNEAARHFNETELPRLVLAINVINTWNRFAVTFRKAAGSYKPDHPVTHRGQAK